MKYEWFDGYCLSKKGAEKDFKEEWGATRYLIGGKMFVLVGQDKQKEEIITLKCEPSVAQMFRDQYQHVVAGYYMNKEHWNSVYVDGDVPDDELKTMVDMSYRLVLGSFSKKKQMEITRGE